MDNMTVTYTCKICQREKLVEVESSDCDLFQAMFDIAFPLLTCNRCADWRSACASMRDTAGKLGRRLYDLDQSKERDKGEIRRVLCQKLESICARFVEVNCAYLRLSRRSSSGLYDFVLSQPLAASDALRQHARKMIGEKEQRFEQATAA